MNDEYGFKKYQKLTEYARKPQKHFRTPYPSSASAISDWPGIRPLCHFAFDNDCERQPRQYFCPQASGRGAAFGVTHEKCGTSLNAQETHIVLGRDISIQGTQ
jgi:hypothetical protein